MIRARQDDEKSDAPTSSIVIIRALTAVVSAMGGDRERYLASLGLSPDDLADIEARVPVTLTAMAWKLAAEHAKDPWFGIHFIERLPTGSFDLLEYAMRSSATYGAALEYMARHYRLLEDAAEIEVLVEGDVAQVVHRWIDPRWVPPRHGIEAVVTSWMLRARRLCGPDFTPREAFFQHAAPPDTREHRRVFGASLRFGAAVSGIAFDRSWLDVPQPAADAGLLAVLDRQVGAVLARTPSVEGLEARIYHALSQLLPSGQSHLGAVAHRLGTSRRSLQRALASDGTSFQTLVSRARNQLACRYLDEGNIPIAQISFALGFSSPSAFQRAFRRWTGLTPLAYRRSAASRPAGQALREG